MITVKTLKKILDKLPDNARLYAYEGECTGIVIYDGCDIFSSKKTWFIPAHETSDSDNPEIEEIIDFEKIEEKK
jgi:hypothetical protein